MSTATLENYILNLLSIVLPMLTVLPALHGSEFIKKRNKRYMILDSLRSYSINFSKLYDKIEFSMSPLYFAAIIVTMLIFSLISLYATNVGSGVYMDMVNASFVAYTIISLLSIISYCLIKRNWKSRTDVTVEMQEKKVMQFKKWLQSTSFF